MSRAPLCPRIAALIPSSSILEALGDSRVSDMIARRNSCQALSGCGPATEVTYRRLGFPARVGSGAGGFHADHELRSKIQRRRLPGHHDTLISERLISPSWATSRRTTQVSRTCMFMRGREIRRHRARRSAAFEPTLEAGGRIVTTSASQDARRIRPCALGFIVIGLQSRVDAKVD